jgi:hypothetical protein
MSGWFDRLRQRARQRSGPKAQRGSVSLASPRPSSADGAGPRVFISHKRNVALDNTLANHLHDYLNQHGCRAFIDLEILPGFDWTQEIDRQIKACDFFVVLLSETSVSSEMVQAEVKRAYDYRQIYGHPQSVPIRVDHEALLPFGIETFLGPVQYVVCKAKGDCGRVCSEILATIQGQSPVPLARNIPAPIAPQLLSEDGQPLAERGDLSPPTPAFDLRFLKELSAPGGTLRLRSEFYVRRRADVQLEQELARPGALVTVRAGRQTGKSSLLVRGVDYARTQGYRVALLDLQSVDQATLHDPALFMRYLGDAMMTKLGLDPGQAGAIWHDAVPPQVNLTRLLENYVLTQGDEPIVLAMDEADRLLATSYRSDFFGLIRSWYNSSALDERWQKLRIVMVISTEPYLLIEDSNQSPFNVGLKLRLTDFDEAQVSDLNQRHGAPLAAAEVPQLVELLGGHPYLTRKVLYVLARGEQSWSELQRSAPTDGGPFGDHLKHYLWILGDHPELRKALKQIIRRRRCNDEAAHHRLRQAGLVRGEQHGCRCRNELYRTYFGAKL